MADGIIGPSQAELGLTQKDLGIDQSTEATPAKKLDATVDRFVSLYKLSPEVAERVKCVPVIVNDSEKFRQARNGYIKEYMESGVKHERGYQTAQDDQRRRNIEEMAQREIADYYQRHSSKDLDQEMARSGGSYIQRMDGQEAIFVQDNSINTKDETLAHETLHALASKGFEKGTGFKEGPGRIAFVRSQGLNEASTELLRIAAQMQGVELTDEVIDAILEGKVKYGYKTHVKLLAGILGASQLPGGSPVTIDTLADFYFGRVSRDPLLAQEDFKELLISSVPAKYQDLVEQLIPERT